MALLLLGPHAGAWSSRVAGAWTQCTFNVRQPYPPYRTVFSMAAEAITMQATGLVYVSLGGAAGAAAPGVAAKAAGRRDRARISSSTPASWPAPSRCRRRQRAVEGVARQLSLERAELHGGRARPARLPRWSIERGNHWLALLMLGAGLSDLSHLPGLPRPDRRPAAARRGDAAAARRDGRGAAAGAARRAGARGRKGAPGRHAAQHRRRRDHDRSRRHRAVDQQRRRRR